MPSPEFSPITPKTTGKSATVEDRTESERPPSPTTVRLPAKENPPTTQMKPPSEPDVPASPKEKTTGQGVSTEADPPATPQHSRPHVANWLGNLSVTDETDMEDPFAKWGMVAPPGFLPLRDPASGHDPVYS